MALDDFLLSILVCPETKAKVNLAEQSLVEEINRQIEGGTLKNVAGKAVHEKIDALLIREDGKRAYPVRQDIPIMLIEEGINL